MRFVMITLNRNPIYVQDAIASLYDSFAASHRVRLWVLNTSVTGEPGDHGFLGPWADDYRVEVFNYQPKMRDRALRLPLRERCALAHWYGLRLIEGDEGILFEDDITFANGWYQFTLDALELLPKRASSMVELYSPHLHTAIDPSTPLAVYDVTTFYGSQACFFGADAVRPARDALEPTPARGNRKHSSDTLLQAWLMAEPQPFYALVPSVVQHVGRVSSIDSTDHTSPSYRDDLSNQPGENTDERRPDSPRR